MTLPRPSRWSEYAAQAAHYTASDMRQKQDFVWAACHKFKPQAVLDVGANTGQFSLLAASEGARVVAIDTDQAALEKLATSASQQGADILTLVVDIARPTPAMGWNNGETISFIDRCAGKFDLVMMLAVIHHLILVAQIPLNRIAELCATLTTRHLLLEWVPAPDPMFQALLRGRHHLYGALGESDFHAAFQPRFSVLESRRLPNGRTLFLLAKACL